MKKRTRRSHDRAKLENLVRAIQEAKPDTMSRSIFDGIAAHDGSLYTVWGPCSDGTKNPCGCPQCQHADRLIADGKDWDIEYKRARLRGFDKDE